MQAMGEEKRRHQRFDLTNPLKVIDTISDELLGLVVNISVEGLMVIGDKLVVDGSVYQIEIPVGEGGEPKFYAGIECLWTSEADSADKNWSGFRIIDISDENAALLDQVISQL